MVPTSRTSRRARTCHAACSGAWAPQRQLSPLLLFDRSSLASSGYAALVCGLRAALSCVPQKKLLASAKVAAFLLRALVLVSPSVCHRSGPLHTTGGSHSMAAYRQPSGRTRSGLASADRAGTQSAARIRTSTSAPARRRQPLETARGEEYQNTRVKK